MRVGVCCGITLSVAAGCGLQIDGLGDVRLPSDGGAPFDGARPLPTLDAGRGDGADAPDGSDPTSAGLLTVTPSAPAPAIDLTATGTLDWTHWGSSQAPSSIVRKAGVTTAIADFVPVGISDFTRFGDGAVSFRWSDGTPDPTSGGTGTGVYVLGAGHGFDVSVDASASDARTLLLWVGGYRASATLTASLSDGSAAPREDDPLGSDAGPFNLAYAIQFRAAHDGAKLVVRWTQRDDHGGGNVTLQSAALR